LFRRVREASLAAVVRAAVRSTEGAWAAARVVMDAEVIVRRVLGAATALALRACTPRVIG
jgi:hypothetical protein